MLELHNLKKTSGSTKRRRRLGRGNASGMGNYSTRGMKGQRSRSGGKSGLALRSIKSYLLRVPKVRGFKSFRKPMTTVNLGTLDKSFAKGQIVNARAMLKAGLIDNVANKVKVLAEGKLTKNLLIEAHAFSKSAEEIIIKAGGQAIVIKNKKEETKSSVSNK